MVDPTSLADRRGFDTRVYEPAEDSALLAEVVRGVVSPGDRVLDVGTGSGYIGSRMLEASGGCVIGSDVNPHACREAHRSGLAVIQGDLVSAFQPGVFDVVVFNPPYLPGRGDEWNDWFEVATMSGETGRDTIERFLGAVGRVLAPNGQVFILMSSVTGVEEVVAFADECGFSAAAVREESFPGETLTVLKFVR